MGQLGNLAAEAARKRKEANPDLVEPTAPTTYKIGSGVGPVKAGPNTDPAASGAPRGKAPVKAPTTPAPKPVELSAGDRELAKSKDYRR